MLDEPKLPNGTHNLMDAKPLAALAWSRISHFQTQKSQVKTALFAPNLQDFIAFNIVLLQNSMWMGLASPTSTLILDLVGPDSCQSAATQMKHEKYATYILKIDQSLSSTFSISYTFGSSLQVPKVQRMI
jgi:hypothetical protein